MIIVLLWLVCLRTRCLDRMAGRALHPACSHALLVGVGAADDVGQGVCQLQRHHAKHTLEGQSSISSAPSSAASPSSSSKSSRSA